MKKHIQSKELNRIEKRAIEALAVAPVIRAVAQRIGMESALAILREINRQEAYQRGQSMQKSDGQNGIDELVDEVAPGERVACGKWKFWNELRQLIFSTLPAVHIMRNIES